MSVEVKIPPLPESVGEGIIWNITLKQGQEVIKDQRLFDIETDKAVLEVVSPCNGVVENISVANADVVTSNQPVMSLLEESGSDYTSHIESEPGMSPHEAHCEGGAAESNNELVSMTGWAFILTFIVLCVLFTIL